MTDLSTREPSQLFDPGWAAEYEHMRATFHQRIMRHLDVMHLVWKIARFPFRSLYEGQPLPFWITTYHSLYDSAVLGIWRLVVDNKGGFLTLGQWRDLIMTKTRLKKDKAVFVEALGSLDYGDQRKNLTKPIREYRHQKVGHFKRGLLDGSVREVEPEELPPQHFKAMDAEIMKMYRVLSLGALPSFAGSLYKNPGPHSTSNNTPNAEDIDEMLTRLADESHWMHYPDRGNQYTWENRRSQIRTWGEAQMFDHYRKRLGLSLQFS